MNSNYKTILVKPCEVIECNKHVMFNKPYEVIECNKHVMFNKKHYNSGEEPSYTDCYGSKIWLDSDGLYHRENDKPAIIDVDGTMMWYTHGKLHRDHAMPAIVSSTLCAWFIDNVQIRKNPFITDDTAHNISFLPVEIDTKVGSYYITVD